MLLTICACGYTAPVSHIRPMPARRMAKPIRSHSPWAHRRETIMINPPMAAGMELMCWSVDKTGFSEIIGMMIETLLP